MNRRFRCPIAVHLLVFEGDRVLLSRRANTGFGDGAYSVVAGCCDGGESASAAMCREAAEEAGIVIGCDDLKLATTVHRRAGAAWESIDLFFQVTRHLETVENREPDKCSHLAFFPLSALPDSLLPYVRHALTNALAGVAYSEFGWDD
ncbi:MAG: NUDIX domain-containing protein [Myxococcales bacterium]|nr:NUDIX domain-containing protein [Myxococcales bacterium]